MKAALLKEAAASYLDLWETTQNPGERLERMSVELDQFADLIQLAQKAAAVTPPQWAGYSFALIMFGVGRAYGIAQATGGDDT